MTQPFQIGCIGSSGYANVLLGTYINHVPHERAVISAIYSIQPDTLADHPATAAYHPKFVSEDELFALPLDAVLVPTSIDSHLPFTKRALEAGINVHVEKPITATIDDAIEMQRVRDATGKVVAVGYQAAYAESVQWARQQIAAGAIGKVRRVRVMACWPRNDVYYNRNHWAGRVSVDGRYVLDSPANNALAHQINLALYLSGDCAVGTSNRATSVTAELYRGRPIENYDTCAIRAGTAGGAEVLVLLTHACDVAFQPVVEVIGETGTMLRTTEKGGTCRLIRGGQTVDECFNTVGDHVSMVDNFLSVLAGKVDQPICTIENGMEPTRLLNGASQATPVHTVPAERVEQHDRRADKSSTVYVIAGINDVFAECYEKFALPHELGVDWARPAGSLDLTGYDSFAGTADELAAGKA